MISLDAAIITALKADATLVAAVGGNRFYNLKAPNAGEFPRISFFELSNTIALGGDNAEYLAEVAYQFDVWSKTSPEPTICSRLETVLKGIGFTRENFYKLYESDTSIYHSVLTVVATVHTT